MLTCNVTGCYNKRNAKGYCSLHYARSVRGTRMEQQVRLYDSSRVCNILDCYEPHGYNGYCSKHARRLLNNRRKEEMVSLFGGKCHDCGDDFPPHVFDFDNIEDGPGHTSIGRLMSRGAPMSRLLEELKRCEMVCANCHRIRTFARYEKLELA